MANINLDDGTVTLDKDYGEEILKTNNKAFNMEKFAALNKLVLKDLNDRTNKNGGSSFLKQFNKKTIADYVSNPAKNEKNLRDAVNYIYVASTHFSRLIQYFVGLSDLAYIVSPKEIADTDSESFLEDYKKTLSTLDSFNIKSQFRDILTVCLREDTYYGTMHVADGNIIIQRLPSDYCQITTIEDGVPNVTFDFSYFQKNEKLLDSYPKEFKRKYNKIKNNKSGQGKWVELDSPTSFAIKCNSDILEYSVPPFIGVLRDIYDLEDYRNLKLTKTEIENYAILEMLLPMDEHGNWGIDLDKARDFWENLNEVLPEEIGSILTPMPLKKISFERSAAADNNTIADAEQNLFTAAGVSSLLFNNDKASSNALLLSIKADQALTYGIVLSIENMLNRYLRTLSYGSNFKVTFLDCSPYNRKELGDQYLKAAQYGLPTVMAYAASQGLEQSKFDTMNFLENDVLGLKDKLIPLRSSNTQSKADLESEAPTDEGGRPPKEDADITDSGEQSREDGDDWG